MGRWRQKGSHRTCPSQPVSVSESQGRRKATNTTSIPPATPPVCHLRGSVALQRWSRAALIQGAVASPPICLLDSPLVPLAVPPQTFWPPPDFLFFCEARSKCSPSLMDGLGPVRRPPDEGDQEMEGSVTQDLPRAHTHAHTLVHAGTHMLPFRPVRITGHGHSCAAEQRDEDLLLEKYESRYPQTQNILSSALAFVSHALTHKSSCLRCVVELFLICRCETVGFVDFF